MPFSRSRALVAALSAAVLIALTGCSGGGASGGSGSSGPTTITFWHEMAGPAAKKLNELVSTFNSQNKDGITVKASFQGSYADVQTKYTAAVQSSTTPDLLMMNDTSTGFMIDSKQTTPLHTLAGSDPAFAADTFPAPARSYYGSPSGLLAMPFSVSQPVLYLNRALVQKAGLDVTKPPTTLTEVADWATRVRAAGGTYGFSMLMSDSWMLEQLSATGGELFCTPDNGRGSGRATGVQMTTPTQVAFLSTLRGLYTSGTALNSGTDTAAMVAAFAAGKVGLMLASSGSYTTADPTRKAAVVAPFPKSAQAAAGGPVIGGNALWISGPGHSDAQQRAAVKFAAFLHTAENQAAWAGATGYLAANTAATGTADGKQSLADANVATMYRQLAETPVSPASAGCRTGAFPAVRPTVTSAFARIVEGGDVTALMTEAERTAKQQISTYNTTAG